MAALMLVRVLVLAACASPCACTQTYHPEYHPVTVTTVHQSVSAQAVTPAGITPVVVQQPRLADPEVFFQAR
jgi:ABC-type uncharacterized transport system auxiliary subunit